MRLQIFLWVFGLWSLLYCSTKGTPPNADRGRKNVRRILEKNLDTLYTPEEERLIISKLESLTGPYQHSIWKEIEAAHKNNRKSKCLGFNVDRTWKSLRRHFFNYMIKKDRPLGAVEVPDSVKKLTSKTFWKFTPQEDAFINGELSITNETNIYSRELWKLIKQKHDWSRSIGAKFPVERTQDSLQRHFLNSLRRHSQKVPESILQKFPRILEAIQGRSSKSSTTKKQTTSSQEDHTDGEVTDGEMGDINDGEDTEDQE